MATYADRVRQGLPRVPGGDPWPSVAAVPADAQQPVQHDAPEATAAAPPAERQVPVVLQSPAKRQSTATSTESVQNSVPERESTAAGALAGGIEHAAGSVPLRRGLPRVAGGEPWPHAGFAPATTVSSVSVATPVPDAAPDPVLEPVRETPAAPQSVAQSKEPTQQESIMLGSRTLAQWVKLGVLGLVGVIVAAGIIVLAARGVTTLPGVPAWLERYPGTYPLPEGTEPGFPAWARWGHFFNLFLIVLIIRSGWLVRTQQQPPAFWTPKARGKKQGGKKISLNLWLHTSLDLLWVVNGVVFVVLLFASGKWARIIPTSWEVFPNAASAMLQYLTLDWPVEDGWVQYNALQQLMYFVVVFIAAPLAIVTGVRMSEWWPQEAHRLNRWYPAPLARAIHFPTMLFFLAFILVHVFLVFTTGALKNLNHMFAGQPVVSWTGFWLFVVAIAVTAAGWMACRPLVLAPIANLFGKVSNR